MLQAHTEALPKQASPSWHRPQVAEKPSSAGSWATLTPSAGSAPCHQLIMPACLFIYRLYKKSQMHCSAHRKREGAPWGRGRRGLDPGNHHPPPGFSLLKQELGPRGDPGLWVSKPAS